MRFLFLFALVFAQETDFDRQVSRLGDPDPAVREQATRGLAGRVESARPALERGRASADAEIRVRSAALLHRHHRDLLEKRLEREQRGDRLKVYWESPADSAGTEGGIFSFHRRPWPRRGEVLGTVFETELRTPVYVEFDWGVWGVRTDRDLKVERCLHHSPRLVYVAGPELSEARVTVQGTRRWYCGVPVEFRPPSDGAAERVGPFLITLAWPWIHVRADRPMSQAVLRRTLTSADISIRLKPDRFKVAGDGLLSEICCGFRLMPQEQTWCGCDGKPAQGERPAADLREAMSVSIPGAASYTIEDLEAISLTFRKPIEEPFEITSPPLKHIPVSAPAGR